MSNLTIVVILIIVVCIVGVYLNHTHSRKFHYDADKLSAAIGKVFGGDTKKKVSQNQLMHELIAEFHCTKKIAHVLIGKAQKEGMITISDNLVMLAGNSDKDKSQE